VNDFNENCVDSMHDVEKKNWCGVSFAKYKLGIDHMLGI